MIALFLLMTSACASLKVSIPNAKVETPETIGGEFDFAYQIILHPTNIYEFTDSAGSRPPTLDEPTLTRRGSVTGQGLTSFNEKLDIGINFASSTTSLQLKYQFLGESLVKSAESSQVAAVYTSIGFGDNTISGDQAYTFGPGGHLWNANSKVNYNEIGFSWGYRYNSKKMVYIGYSYNEHKLSGHIDQKPSTSTANDGGNYDFSPVRGTNQTLAVGTEIGDSSRLRFQIGINREQIGNFNLNTGYFSIGIMDRFGDKEVKTEKIEKEIWKLSDFGAVGCSWLVGFGCGQNIQNRWENKGRYFALVDGLAFSIAMGSAFENVGSTNNKYAISAYLISRFWQLIDTIMDASSHDSERPVITLSSGLNGPPLLVGIFQF